MKKRLKDADSGMAGSAVQPAKETKTAQAVAFIGMLGALAAVLMMLEIPLPFAPSFLKMDFGELPGLFAGFFLGPAAGAGVVFVKIALKLLFKGTSTAYAGDFSNLTGSLIFVLTAAFIYKKNKTKKGAIIAMVVSTAVVSVVYIFLNAFIMFPLYSSLYGLPMDVIIGMGSAVNPFVHDELTMMLWAVLPFNLVKYSLTSLITFLLYKRCGNALRSIMAKR